MPDITYSCGCQSDDEISTSPFDASRHGPPRDALGGRAVHRQCPRHAIADPNSGDRTWTRLTRSAMEMGAYNPDTAELETIDAINPSSSSRLLSTASDMAPSQNARTHNNAPAVRISATFSTASTLVNSPYGSPGGSIRSRHSACSSTSIARDSCRSGIRSSGSISCSEQGPSSPRGSWSSLSLRNMRMGANSSRSSNFSSRHESVTSLNSMYGGSRPGSPSIPVSNSNVPSVVDLRRSGSVTSVQSTDTGRATITGRITSGLRDRLRNVRSRLRRWG